MKQAGAGSWARELLSAMQVLDSVNTEKSRFGNAIKKHSLLTHNHRHISSLSRIIWASIHCGGFHKTPRKGLSSPCIDASSSSSTILILPSSLDPTTFSGVPAGKSHSSSFCFKE